MITPSTINSHNQTRSDSKAGYIDPMPPRSNLVILTGQQVTQVIFNGSTDASGNIIASGVKFQASSTAASYSVQANKEVILRWVRAHHGVSSCAAAPCSFSAAADIRLVDGSC
jgi:choline dehydrogenase